jgi:hypothetical protein
MMLDDRALPWTVAGSGFAEKADIGDQNDLMPTMSAFTSTGKSLILPDAHF